MPNANNPKNFLADLDNWTQKYPTTDFADRRGMYYIQAYRANGDLGKALSAAKPLLDEGVDALTAGLEDPGLVLNTLFLASNVAAALTATGTPTPDQLAVGQKAAQMLADYGKVFFAPDKKARNVGRRLGSRPEADPGPGAGDPVRHRDLSGDLRDEGQSHATRPLVPRPNRLSRR